MPNNLTLCHQCNRGGNGNDVDKCSCGWKQIEPSCLGCFLGTPIIGDIIKKPKLSRSKQRYQRYLEYGDWFDSFIDFCRWDYKQERTMN